MTKDIAFEMAVSSVRFGVGVTREVGMDLAEMGAKLVLVVTDPVLAKLPPVRTVLESLEQNKIPYAVYDRVRVEPSDESFLDAIAFAKERPFDAFVAVGGGSTIDTAKAVNLYTTYPPADFLDYVNPPIGKGLPVPGSAEAAARDSDDGRHRERDDRRDASSTTRSCRRRPASPTAGSSRRSATSIRTTRGRCRRRWRRRPDSTS